MKKIAEKKHHLWLEAALIIILLLALYVIWALVVAVPKLKPVNADLISSATVPGSSIAWPTSGQAAIGLNNAGVIATNGAQKPTPTASAAKLITALCVLKEYPLSTGQTGPSITITPADVAIYDKYQSEDGSDMLVASGEQISEYQMLEGLLLPSADNIADTLAIWAFGSLSSYSTYANQFVKDNGLSSTHVGLDGSGFDPSTTSTASDLVRLGQLAMDSPVIAGIVSQSSVSGLPEVGTIKNVNFVLGQDGIIGIKTGNTDQAGGVFISASKVLVNGTPQTLITAVMGSSTLFDAVYGSLPFITSAQANFSSPYNIADISRGSVVGKYIVPWSGQTVTAIASQPISLKSWGGSQMTETIRLKQISDSAQANQVIGSITTSTNLLHESSTTPVILSQPVGAPSRWWLILHPQSFIRF